MNEIINVISEIKTDDIEMSRNSTLLEDTHQLIIGGPKYVYGISTSDYDDFVKVANKNNWEFCVLKEKNKRLLISCSEDYNSFLYFRQSMKF